MTPGRNIVIYNNGLIWCPAAKTGSTTILHAMHAPSSHTHHAHDHHATGSSAAAALGSVRSGGKVSVVGAWSLTPAQKSVLCSRPHLTFTMTRDPFDRLVSAYIDKVVLGGSGCNKAKEVMKKQHPLTKYPTFSQFLEALRDMELESMDPHTYPFSYRCGTGASSNYTYDMIGRLAHFDSDMQTLYNVLELGTYEPYNNKDLGNVSWGMDERLELLKTFSLRPDTLAMHGRERVSYFYGDGPTGLRKLVSDGWWKEDVKQFGEY